MIWLKEKCHPKIVNVTYAIFSHFGGEDMHHFLVVKRKFHHARYRHNCFCFYLEVIWKLYMVLKDVHRCQVFKG